MNSVYLDYNSTTPIIKEVLEGMTQYCGLPLNPSSVHSYGQNAKGLLNAAKEQVKNMVNANSGYELIFTSSGTESNNIALRSFEDINLLITTTEHPSVLYLAKEALIPVNKHGVVELDILEMLIKNQKHPFLASVMLANNETGVIQDIAAIADLVHRHGGILHTDASQACGRIKVDISDLGADMMTISSHKIGGPVGASALIFKKNLQLKPLMRGGGQELRLRPGTQNVLAIAGFGIASTIAVDSYEKYVSIAAIRDRMELQVLKISADTIIFGAAAKRLPNTSTFTMPGVDSDVQVVFFDTKKIAISAGAACSSGNRNLPYVQMSMGYTEKVAREAIRVSLGLSTKEEEIDFFIKCWRELFVSNSNKYKVGNNE